MAKLNVAVRLCCILGVNAGLGPLTMTTQISVGDSPSAGVGFYIKLADCDATYGCTTNSTAIFKVEDDNGIVLVDTFCSAFDFFNDEKTGPGSTTVAAHFFYAFTMPAGHTGSYWMSKGCFMDGDASLADDTGGIYPTNSEKQPVDYKDGSTVQYTNQPAGSEKVLAGNRTDVFIPYLLLATPHSPNDALGAGTYRTAQFKYVTKDTPLQLYFSEPVTGVEGKLVYVYAYTPSQAWTGATSSQPSTTKDAKNGFQTGMLDTKAYTSLDLTENRLYKVLIDAGAFVDANANAAAGVNGLGSSYDTCVAVDTAAKPIDRDCLIAFVVPMTFAGGDGVFPAAVAGDPVDVSQSTAVTKSTNVAFTFPEAVEPGKYSSSMSLSFGSELAGADLVIAGTASNCFDDNSAGYCYKLFSSTYYIFEPRADLQDAVTTANSTEVTVSFTTGAFDYVNAFSYTFLTNRTEYDGRAPEIVAYTFSVSGATYAGDTVYYLDEETNAVDEARFLSWSSAEKLILYFDTRVEGAATKYVTFTPETYATEDAKTITTGDCFAAATDLVPCKFTADSGLVEIVGSTETKVTINPGALIPGQTYNVTVDAGAFIGKATDGTNGATAAWHTSFYVPQAVAACTVSDGDSTRPLHRTASIKITFTGPVHADGADGAITVGTVDQHVSNPDVVYRRNNKDAGADNFMIIIEPRISESEAGMPADTTVAVNVAPGVLRNFAVTAAADLCSSYTTLYEDSVAPELLSVSGLTGGSTGEPYGFSQYADTTFTLRFSEKVAGSGIATLSHSTGTKTFGLGGSGGSGDTAVAFSDDGRTVSLSVTDGELLAGVWTLSVPYTSLTDMATETGVAGNPFTVSSSCASQDACLEADETAGAAKKSIEVKSVGAGAPTCTTASGAVLQGTLLDTKVQEGTISRTLMLQFAEGVTIRDTTKSIELYAANRTTAAGPAKYQKVLSMGLDGTLSCPAWDSGATLGCDTTTGSLEFNWLETCSMNEDGCVVSEDAALPGGGNYLFIFLHHLVVSADFSSYYFNIEDDTSIVSLYDYPIDCSTVGEFTVYNPHEVVRTEVTLDIGTGSTPDSRAVRGSSDNILLTFNERVQFGAGFDAGTSIATITFKTSLGSAGTAVLLSAGNHSKGVVLSASGREAVVHVPNEEFDYMTVEFVEGSFVDLALTSNTAHENDHKTNATTADYNSTVANSAADPNSTWATGAGREDTVAPTVLMMLPAGASNNVQVLTGINTSAKIYLLMSENVSKASEAGVKLYECGQYVVASVVTGISHAPLTSPSCAALSGPVSTSLTLLDNTYGSSVVEVSPSSGSLKELTKYLLRVAAGTFADRAGNPNVQFGEEDGDEKFEFFTEGSREKPTVTRYKYTETVSDLAIGKEVMIVWFNAPIGNFSAVLSDGLTVAGDGGSPPVGTQLICSGGFKCSVTTTAALAEDTVYLVNLPSTSTISDREGNIFAGAAAAVSFKTTLTDVVAPRVAFCSDVSVGTKSISLKLGFTEAVALYGGYTSKTDVTDAYLQNNWDLTDKKSVQMQLEAGGAVLSIASAEDLDENTAYSLYIGAAQIKDAAQNVLQADVMVNTTSGANVDCATDLKTGTADTTTPTHSATLPSTASVTVHNGDSVVFSFNEEVAAGAEGASLTLTKCGVASTKTACTGGSTEDTIAAVDLKFGGNNAMWQIGDLEQGVVYKVSALSGTFADLAGNSYGTDVTSTFQVALEKWDYRGSAGTPITRAEAHHATTVATFAGGSRLGVHGVDATAPQTLSLYFAQKVQGASLKVYFNSTSTDHYFEVTQQVDGEGKSLSLALPSNSLQGGMTYQLEAYVDDVDWSTNIFEDADEYYTYFGNYKATTKYYSAYARPDGTRFTFNTGAPATATYYSAPTLADPPFSIGWGNTVLNASANVSTSAMIQVDVTTNGTLEITKDFKVHRAARISASTLADTACTSTFATCCSSNWAADGSTQSHYIDYSVANAAKVYFSLEGGFDAYSCYRVAINAAAFQNTGDEGSAPIAESPDYVTWFTTDALAHDGDAESPAAPTFGVSSQDSTSSFRLVSRSAFLTLEFDEPIVAGADVASLVTLQDDASANVACTKSVSGNQVTVTPDAVLAAGTTFTLTAAAGAVKDASGNFLSTAYAQTFATVFNDADTPTVLHSIPESTDTASIDARMVLFMSEQVSANSATAATIGGNTVTMTQSTWAGFQDAIHANTQGAVIVEHARVTFASHKQLPEGAGAKLAVPNAALKDQYGNGAGAVTVTFTAATFGTFGEPSLAGSPIYGGDVNVQLMGATAVSCGETLYLVGGWDGAGSAVGNNGGDGIVSTWDGAAWTAVSTTGLGDRRYASVAADKDCTLWVVGGSGESGLAKSGDSGATFTPVVPTPLPVGTVQDDGSILVGEGSAMVPAELAGSSVAVVNGWQVVVCGGGLDTCWICKDVDCGVAGRSGPVPNAVSNRFYGSMLVVGGDAVYYLGGQDGAFGSETLCHQSVYLWDFFSDQWEGMTAQIDLDTAPPRCESSYAQAGDGMIVVVGGNNATDSTKGEYSVGALTTVLEAARPLLDSTDYLSGSTYADKYARPTLFAYGPTSTTLTAGLASEPVVLVFSEPVQAGAGCVDILDTNTAATLYCSAYEGSCYTTACAGATGVKVAGTTVSIARSIVTIDIATRGKTAGNAVSVTLNDAIVQDVMGNGFLSSEGSSSRAQVDSFNFGFSAAAAAFSGSIAQPQASAEVDLDTNVVFKFSRDLDEATSIMSGFALTLLPAVGSSTVSFNENNTDSFAFAGDILKVKMPSATSLIPGMTYTATLAGSSVQSADGAALTTPSTRTFTARNGPARGAGVAEAGVAYVIDVADLRDEVPDQNDTGGVAPTVASISPPSGMTGVRKDAVHVVYTFSEAVTLQDAGNQSNGVISEAFSLQFFNTSSSAWEHTEDLALGVKVFVNTTGKTITAALSNLIENTKYTIVFDEAVVTDFGGTAPGDVWTQVSSSLGTGYSFTTVGSVTDTSKPKVVASYVTPLTSADSIILGDDEVTEVMVVFDRPLVVDSSSPGADCVNGGATDTPNCALISAVSDAEVLLVTIPDFQSSASAWNLHLTDAEPGSNFVNMSAVLPALVTLSDAFPVDTGSTYDKYSDESTIVLQFTEDIQAGSGTVSVTAQKDATSSLEFSVDASEVTLVGKYLVIETDELMAGEAYQVSMTNGTIRGATGRAGKQTNDFVPSAKQFATVPKMRFATSSALTGATVEVYGAGVAFGPDNRLYAAGGKREQSDTVSNYTYVSATYRDTDAGAGSDTPSRCTDPCQGAPQTVTSKIYGVPSTRGLRQLNSDGVAHSVLDVSLEVTDGANCACPVCIDSPLPATIPANGHFFHGVNTVYTQVDAAATESPLACDVGVDGGLEANQGYDATDVFLCTVGDTTDEADAVAEYFGIWKIEPSACAPKHCLTAPTFPAELFDGSESGECAGYTANQEGNWSTFDMDHDDNCTVSCNPGYQKGGVFKCDRGIYSDTVTCTPRSCGHPDVANGALDSSEVGFEGSFTVTCDAGYEATGGRSSVTCDADTTAAESTVGAGLSPLSCQKMTCGTKPSVANGEVECSDSSLAFLSTCTVTCGAGYHYDNAGGSQTQSGAVTCEAGAGGSVEWSGVAACAAVVCSVPNFPSGAAGFENASPTDTAVASVNYNEGLTLACSPGYSTDPADKSKNSLTATCTTDSDYSSLLDTDGDACQALDCPELSTVSGGFTVDAGTACGGSTGPFPAGDQCTFACGTGKLSVPDASHVTCVEGVLNLCISAACEKADLKPVNSGIPACVDAQAAMQEQVVVRSVASIGLSGSSARRLGAQEDIENEIVQVLAAFSKAMATTLGVSADKVVVEDHTLSDVGGTLTLVVQFYVEVEAGAASDDMAAVLTSFAEGDADLANSLKEQFSAELEKLPGVTVTVGSVSVSLPQKSTIYVAEPTPAPTDAPSEGGGGAAVIVAVVVVVLAVVGLVIYKFVLKK